MLSISGCGLAYRSTGVTGRFPICALGLMLGAAATQMAAQDQPTPTWHVSTNLIQLPVLVLGPDQGRTAPVAENRFKVSIDGGPLFPATHVRIEGDDPISLSILMHVSGFEGSILLPRMNEAVADLAPTYLHGNDHVSVYTLDCALTRWANDVPAERARLTSAVNSAQRSWTERTRDKKHATCSHPLNLWDSLAFLSTSLHKLPGRHVVLAITDGDDKGSRNNWNELRLFAQAEGVAIFGVMYRPDLEPAWMRKREIENRFDAVCQLTGGTILFAEGRDLSKVLQRFTTMLRERYIVEFPPPAKGTPGQHGLVVSIGKSRDFIRSAGVSVPVADAALLADPRTIPQDESRAPVVGSRRILEKRP